MKYAYCIVITKDNIRVVQTINKWEINQEYEDKIIDMLGIQDLLSVHPSQLSGGQQQRVAIARALIGKPAIILADEPTGNLDKKRSEEIINYMKLSNQQYRQAYIVVTHDLEVASQCNRIITLEDGKIIEDLRK